MTVFTFETTVEGVVLVVEADYNSPEAQTLEHPGVAESCDILSIKARDHGTDLMELIEYCGMNTYVEYSTLIEKLGDRALADFRGTVMDGLAEAREESDGASPPLSRELLSWPHGGAS